MRNVLLSIVVAALSYLLGCISTGLIVAKQSGVNLRQLGSKSTGASNVLRVMGFKKGLFTFVGDFLKAILSCWIGSLLLPGATFGIQGYGIMMAGFFVTIGHNWPVFYAFKGGKGVACSVAILLFSNPLLGGISIVLCIIVIAVTRFISLGSLSMLFCFMILMCIHSWGQWFLCVWTASLFLLCVYRHRANIQRLLKGTENKIGNKTPSNNPQ